MCKYDPMNATGPYEIQNNITLGNGLLSSDTKLETVPMFAIS